MYPNPSYLEILNKETLRTRLEYAERQRMIRAFTLANPHWTRKIWLIIRDRLVNFWRGNEDRSLYPPISALPGKSTS